MKQRLKRLFPEVSNGWQALSGYQRFERLVSMVLTLAIGGAVLVAMYYLVIHVVQHYGAGTQVYGAGYGSYRPLANWRPIDGGLGVRRLLLAGAPWQQYERRSG